MHKPHRSAVVSCCMLTVHAWCICDVADTTDGLPECVWGKAWMALSNTLPFHRLATDSLICVVYFMRQNLLALVHFPLRSWQRNNPWLTDLTYVARLR